MPSGLAYEVVAVCQGVRVLGTLDPLKNEQQGGILVEGPAVAPAAPVPWARLARTARALECSAPDTRSRTGSSLANWPRCPGRIASSWSSVRGGRGIGCSADRGRIPAHRCG